MSDHRVIESVSVVCTYLQSSSNPSAAVRLGLRGAEKRDALLWRISAALCATWHVLFIIYCFVFLALCSTRVKRALGNQPVGRAFVPVKGNIWLVSVLHLRCCDGITILLSPRLSFSSFKWSSSSDESMHHSGFIPLSDLSFSSYNVDYPLLVIRPTRIQNGEVKFVKIFIVYLLYFIQKL